MKAVRSLDDETVKDCRGESLTHNRKGTLSAQTRPAFAGARPAVPLSRSPVGQSPTINSTGQRPVLGAPQACRLKAYHQSGGPALAQVRPIRAGATPRTDDARLSALNFLFNANVGRCPTLLIAGRCPTDMQGTRLRSVGQRPTYRQHNVIKAVSLAHKQVSQCARLTALNFLFHANVGRCPTLVSSRLSALLKPTQ